MPARHALTSGAAPHITGCVDNFDIECRRSSFIDGLNDLGYQTHGVGKMHFNHCKGDWGFQGRDISEEIEGEAHRDDYRQCLQDNGYGHIIDPCGFRSEFYYLPQPSQLPDEMHNSTWIADRSIDFLNRRDRSRPFFLWSSFIKPHPPFECPVPWSRLYRMHEMDEPHRPDGFENYHNFWSKVQNRYKYMDSGYAPHLARMIKAAYYSMVSHLDYHLGRIVEALGSDIDNTLIVFSSDHGEMLGDYGCYGKRSMLDASVRVPLVVQLPGVFEAGGKCRNPASLLDLYPTFLEIAGGSCDNSSEGVSLQSLRSGDYRDRDVYSQFSQNQLGLYMLANRSWKYIYSAPDHREWLFRIDHEELDLSADPEHQQILCSLREKCVSRFASDGYTSPIDGDNWRQFERIEIPRDPEEGLLFQDPPTLEQAITGLGPGYARGGIDKLQEKFHLLSKLVSISMDNPDNEAIRKAGIRL